MADDAPGRQQQLSLVVEMIFGSCSCGLGLKMRRRKSVVAAGPQPALGEVVTVSSQGSDRGHDVSILMAVTGAVGR